MKMQLVKKDNKIYPNKYSPESEVMFYHLTPFPYLDMSVGNWETMPFFTLVDAHGWEIEWLEDHKPEGPYG